MHFFRVKNAPVFESNRFILKFKYFPKNYYLNKKSVSSSKKINKNFLILVSIVTQFSVFRMINAVFVY
jgi:hypothetical protein